MPPRAGQSKRSTRPAAGVRKPGVRKPKGRGHERHAEILAAAARMFIELGVDNVSTRGIAQAVGISQTTLYVYFPNKNAILDALCDLCFSGLIERFRRETAGGGEPVELLRRVMRAYVEFGVEHSDEYRLGFMVKRRHEPGEDAAVLFNPATPLEALPIGLQCFRILQDRVNELGRLGKLRIDPALATQAIWAAGHGLVTLLITMPEFPWVERETLISGCLDVLIVGLLA